MRSVLLLTVLMFGAGAAQADGLIYLGAGITRDRLADIAATNSSIDSTSWKVLAGVRPMSLFAVEADYIDLGSDTRNFIDVSTHLRYRAFAGYAVGFAPAPVPYLDVFGKVGIARWTSSGGSFTFPNSFFSLSDNGTQFAWGVGAQLRFGKLGGRLEYENFNVRNTNGASMVSLSVMLSLL
jgi:hypothetical protein